MVVGIGKFCHKCYGRHYIGIFFLALLCFYRGKICLSFESCKYFLQFLLIYQQKQTKNVETFGVLAENAYFCDCLWLNV